MHSADFDSYDKLIYSSYIPFQRCAADDDGDVATLKGPGESSAHQHIMPMWDPHHQLQQLLHPNTGKGQEN